MIEIKSIKEKFNDKWWEKLSHHFEQPYMDQIYKQIMSDVKKGYKVLPSSNNIYQRFKLINPEDVRVVFLTENPICSYAQSKEWGNILSWMEKECFDGFKLVTEENMDYLISQGVINLSSSLTACNKSRHDILPWSYFTRNVVEVLINETFNKKLFVGGNVEALSEIKGFNKHEFIKLEEGCFKQINKFMQINYNTKISW